MMFSSAVQSAAERLHQAGIDDIIILEAHDDCGKTIIITLVLRFV